MDIQDKYTNILDFSDRIIYARERAADVPVATYFFKTEDRTSFEAVTFNLKGGSVTSTAIVPFNYFTTNDKIQYFYNGDAR